LKKYAASSGPFIIRVSGTIQSEPKVYEIPIASEKTIIGMGGDAKLIGGGFAIRGTSNIILRNMQVSDNAVPEDWPGKGEDWDGLQVDNSTNIWIEHMKVRSFTARAWVHVVSDLSQFVRMRDGLVDLRKDTSYVTISNIIFSEHNKVNGIGWTGNVTAKVTINDCWFNSTSVRNPSADNLEMAHLYNNYFLNINGYGTYSRGNDSLLVERSYYENVHDSLVAGLNATVRSNWNKFKGCTGDIMENVKPEEMGV
jgi:pectate lyase